MHMPENIVTEKQPKIVICRLFYSSGVQWVFPHPIASLSQPHRHDSWSSASWPPGKDEIYFGHVLMVMMPRRHHEMVSRPPGHDKR